MPPLTTIYNTLTPAQQQLNGQLQKRVVQGGQPQSLDPQATAKYIQQSVATPLLQQYDQSIMPRLKDAFAAVGAFNSSRRGFASAQALDSLQTSIAAELGKAQLSNQQAGARNALDYNQIGAQLVGQPQMAIQPYTDWNGGLGSSNGLGSVNSWRPFAGMGGQQNQAPLQYSQNFSDYLGQLLNDPNAQTDYTGGND